MTTLLTAKVVQSYGLKDTDQCDDVARALNGMLGFVEKSRGESLGKFYTGVVTVVDELRALRSDLAQMTSEKKEVVEKSEKMKEEIVELLALTGKLNVRKKELEEENKRLGAELGDVKQKFQNLEADLKTERGKSQKLASENQKLTADSGRGKADTKAPSAAKGGAPGAKPVGDKERLDELTQTNRHLAAENARLDTLIRSLTALPPSIEPIVSTERKMRLTQDDATKLRGIVADQAKKIDTMIAEEKQFAALSAEELYQADIKFETEVKKLKSTIEGLEKEVQSLRPPVPRNLQLEQTLLRSLSVDANTISRQTTFLSAFMLKDKSLMVCPVPTRTGTLVQLRDVYTQWRQSPSDNEGTFYATFLCPYSSQITSLASSEQVHLIYQIAYDLELCMHIPLRFQYFDRGNWVDFLLLDQVLIASACCKLYRSARANGSEEVLVCRNMFVLVIHLLDSVVDFQLRSLHDSNDVRPACLLVQVDVKGQASSFFERWSYAAVVSRQDDDVPMT